MDQIGQSLTTSLTAGGIFASYYADSDIIYINDDYSPFSFTKSPTLGAGFHFNVLVSTSGSSECVAYTQPFEIIVNLHHL